MNSIIILVMIYFAAMFGIGYWAAKKVKNADDYMIGGRNFGVALTAIAHQAAGLSGWLFLGFTGLIAKMGLGGIWQAIASGGAPITNFLILAKKMRKFTGMVNARSVIDLLEARYYDNNKKYIRIISVIIIFACMAVYIGSQVMAAGKTFQVILGWDYNLSVIIGSVIVIAYTSAGGLLAVAWTDFIQGILMIVAIAFGLLVGLTHTGGLTGIMDGLRAIDPKLLNIFINPWTAIGLLSAGYLGYLGQPQIIQMFMGMKNENDAQKGAIIAGSTSMFLLFGGLIAMMAAKVLYPNSTDVDTNFIMMMMNYLPSGLVGIVCAGILAAIMSSADALLHVANTTIVQDFYNKVLKGGKAADKEVLFVGRISAIIIGVLALYIAFNPFEGVLWVIWWAWGGLTAFGPVVVLGLHWKRATREGAIAGLISGFAASIIWFALGYYSWLHLSFVSFVTCFVVTVAVSLMTPEPPQEIQEQVESLKLSC
jgi:sodium/proline symporter